ncbi:MAG: T9SS type A sorting domain-containing protein [Bacteroidales bacterium]|nr:T9SS type A sorting domain-containing protein [Bacteroidales bacterium]
MKQHLLILFFLGMAASLVAQEVLLPLSSGPVAQQKGRKDVGGPLSLPFFDDFSNYSGEPSPSLWASQGAWVSNTAAQLPPTVGVLTLDALDADSQLYNTANNTDVFEADIITSRFIRLDSLQAPVARRLLPSDSVALSFYVQPGGGSGDMWMRSGDAPEPSDSLILEFFDGRVGRWIRVWSTGGMDVDSVQRRTGFDWLYVYIPIDSAIFLTRNFRFRFRNLCSFDNTSEAGFVGNCDQWHIDYITLDHSRNYRYYYTRDIAFVNPAPSMLRKYQAMPARQFRASEMATGLDITITNRFEEELSARYTYRVADGYLRDYDGGLDNVPTFFPDGGYQTATAHAHPMVMSAFPTDGIQRVYTITHTVAEGVGGDIHRQNDTIRFYQHLEDFYAYDDGSAENGYGVFSTRGNVMMACQFSLNQPDTLTALDISFCRTRGGENEQMLYYVCVWDDNQGHPGQLLYKDEHSRTPQIAGLDAFVRHELEQPVVVDGIFYVGIQQLSSGIIGIGMDRNHDASEHTFYNVGGAWTQSFLAGALMMRPYVGMQAVLSVQAPRSDASVSIAPNPANNHFEILRAPQGSLFQLLDMQGRCVAASAESRFSTAGLPNGVYILRVLPPQGLPSAHKIMIRHR